jgi:hypothetical protein
VAGLHHYNNTTELEKSIRTPFQSTFINRVEERESTHHIHYTLTPLSIYPENIPLFDSSYI